jgi:hypothetical protein
MTEPDLLWLRTLTWTCMVCGDERPDAVISVTHRQLRGLEEQFPAARWNVRYCNDRPQCAAAAHEPGPWTGRTPRERGDTG